MCIAVHNAIHYTSTAIADHIANVVESEIMTAIADGYDGYLYWLHRIEWEKGSAVIHVIVAREIPNDVREGEEVSRIDVSELKKDFGGIA